MAAYLHIQIATGLVDNVIEYDGVSPYTPDDGYELLPMPDGVNVQAGWTQISPGVFALIGAQLAAYQTKRCAQVDARTAALLNAGMSFTLQVGGTKQFSLAPSMLATWLGFYLAAQAGSLTFPFPGVSTIAGPSATFSSAAEVAAWYQAGVARVEYVQVTGDELKDAINAAADQAGVDAVIDSRS